VKGFCAKKDNIGVKGCKFIKAAAIILHRRLIFDRAGHTQAGPGQQWARIRVFAHDNRLWVPVEQSCCQHGTGCAEADYSGFEILHGFLLTPW
jgi:hypothetical protein